MYRQFRGFLARRYGDDCHARLEAVRQKAAGLASLVNGPLPRKRARGGPPIPLLNTRKNLVR
jgi:hypothetical protein